MSKENILGTLVVVVLKAQHLIDNHTFYKQDPYAKLSLSGATKQTPPDPKGGQHPVWDAELRFPISKEASKNNRTLTISVFAVEKKADELLGEGTVDITDTLQTGEFDDWVPLSLKGTQRGEVYLEMTFFAAGPSPLTRRPTKFTNPAERLGRPQQPVTQRPQRVASQPQPQPPSSSLTPQGQQGPRANSSEAPRQQRPRVQQTPLPGAWPGPSAQRQQSPLAPEPKQDFVPSILRPGGPSHTGNTTPNAYPTQPLPAHQNSPPLSGSRPPQSHISSASPPLEAQQLHALRVSSYSGQGSAAYGGPPSGHQTMQPSNQTQPELADAYARHNLPSQPSPQQQQQTQHLTSQPAPYVSPYPPNNQSYVAPPSSTPPVQSFVAAQNPAPTFSHVATPGPAPPAKSHTPSPGPVPYTQPHAATLSPHPPVHITPAPPSPPSQSYSVTSDPHSRPAVAHSSPPQYYTTSPAPYSTPANPGPHAQQYVSPLAPPTQSRFTPSPSPSPPQHTQSYFSQPNHMFPQAMSPPPMSSYSHSYESAPAPSFPAPSFPVPQPTIDYFGTNAAAAPSPPQPPPPFSAPGDEPDLPDPYLFKRYQTPLPLPPGQSTRHPRPASASASASAAVAAASTRLRDENERAARKLQRREEESARVRREQEERDAELARTLDLELNMDGSGAGAQARGDQPPFLPPRRSEAVGGHRSGMPGAW